MLDFNEYIVNLLAALVHLRVFTTIFSNGCPIENVHRFITKLSDRVPHLEYFSIPPLNHYYKRVGGELVVCDWTECPMFEI